jgi:hypothetical protein
MTLRTYADWAAALNSFAGGDDTILDDICSSSFTLDAGTAVRFMTRIQDAYNARKKAWLEKFNHSTEIQKIRSEDDMSIVLRDAMQNLRPLMKFINANAIPDNAKQTLKNDMESFIGDIKNSMNKSVQQYGGLADRLSMTLNDFTMDNASKDEVSIPQEVKNDQKNANNEPAVNGRRIIF